MKRSRTTGQIARLLLLLAVAGAAAVGASFTRSTAHAVPLPGPLTVFTVPTAASQPTGITGGPDGNAWFTEKAANKIGRVTPTGTFTEFTIPTANSQPSFITAGADGNLWFTETAANQIGRITPA